MRFVRKSSAIYPFIEPSWEAGAAPRDREVQSSGTSAAATSRAVFISYASADAAVAQNVCAALEAAGILCWIAPRDVKPGAQYAGEAGWLFNATQCRVEPAETTVQGSTDWAA